MQIDFDFLSALIAAVLFLPIAIYFWHIKHTGVVRLMFIAAFYIYAVGVLSQVIFPIYLDESMRVAVGQNVWSHINVVPLLHLTKFDVKTCVLNTLLFLPFGFIIHFLKKITYKRVMILAILISLSIECVQFLLAFVSGFTLRYVDINDVIFNVFGTLIGQGFFLVFALVFQRLLKSGIVERNALLNEIDIQTRSNV